MTNKIEPYLASSCCPICGVDTPHSHTRRDLTIQFRAAKLRPIFESRLERWWPQLKQNCYGSYGQAPILTHKKSGFHQAQGLNDEYIWPAVQMLWEVFMYIPCFEQPPLPAEGVPDINEALSIKEHPFAAHAPEQGNVKSYTHGFADGFGRGSQITNDEIKRTIINTINTTIGPCAVCGSTTGCKCNYDPATHAPQEPSAVHKNEPCVLVSRLQEFVGHLPCLCGQVALAMRPPNYHDNCKRHKYIQLIHEAKKVKL